MRVDIFDKRQISECVKDLERRSAAEVVVVLAEASADYGKHTLIVASGFAFFVMLMNLLVPWDVQPWLLVSEAVAAFFFAVFATKILRAGPTFASLAFQRDAVSRQAATEFVRHHVHSTRGRTGILVLVSLAERHIEVVADAGVVSVIPLDSWSFWLNGLDSVMNASDPGSALIEHLGRLGERLEKYLPRRNDAAVELTDEVQVLGWLDQNHAVPAPTSLPPKSLIDCS